MATMVAASRPVPIERALALVRERYGLAPRCARLTGERDENFRLTGADGREYVLKIANAAERPAETDFQTAALLHLERADPALPVPRVVRTRAGEPYVRFADEAGGERTARLLTWLPGKLLGSSQRSSAQRAACGRIGGRLALALRDLRHAAEERAIVWDVRHTGHMRHLLTDMPAFPYREASATLLERLVPPIDAQLPKLRHQILHNDLNPLNILVDPADEARVAGVIDFGDMTRAALIADVAVAAAELIPPGCGATAARAAVREVAIAYHACVPLEERELALLGVLAAARVLMTVVIHEWHVHHNPASDHYAPLDADTMRARLAIADALAREELRL
ncbi:MAG TPA: phosphotransferase [Steroidobacteraceae bacterium]|nr:phosphotransferase [Steroidobacteraceae bacterium]